jgi:sortase (surface protein transpeptidase)
MTDAGPGERGTARARRRIISVIAALLLLGGGAALAIGLLTQHPDPAVPSRSAAGSLHRDAAATPTPEPSTTARTDQDPGLRPVRIGIPAIGVTSPLTVVGLKADSTLEVPQPGPDYDKAAWFDRSPAPGQVGPAVIEGHVDGKVNGPSVFYRLGALKLGNRIAVTRRNHTVVHFVVYAVRLFPKNSFPTLKVYGNTREPELRLITCGGPFDSSRRAGGYTDNVVVFARKA